MLRRIEKRIGRTGLFIGGFLLATLIMCVPVGVLGSSNIVWGEDNQNGRVDIPATNTVIHLPSGSMDASVALFIVGKGNETVDVPLPDDLSLSMTPVNGSGTVTIKRDTGSGTNADDDRANSQIHVWDVTTPHDGLYRVTTRGNFLGIGVNPEVWFGHGPPLPGVLVPAVAAGLVIVFGLIWYAFRGRKWRRPSDDESDDFEPSHGDDMPDFDHHRPLSVDEIGALSKLSDLHQRGQLTDAEFAAEKAKIIAT